MANLLAAAINRQRAVAERRLREATMRRYFNMIESSYDAIVVWHPEKGIEFWNHGAKELYGYSAEEAIGRATHDLLATKHPQPFATIMAALERDGEWDGELIQTTRDGHTVYVSTRHQLMTGQHGDSVILEINRDITQQKEAQLARRQSEEQARRHLNELEAIYNSAPVGLCVMDRELRYLRVNQQLAEMNGLPAADHIGRAGPQLFPDLGVKTEQQLKQVFVTGEPVIGLEVTGEMPASPGVQRTWIESWLPLFNEEHEVFAVNIVIQEITERKKDEEQIGFQANILRQISDAVIAIDEDERITYFNTAASQLYDVALQKALGQPLASVYTNQWPTPDAAAKAHTALAQTGHWRGENFHVRHDGQQIHVESTVSVLESASGQRLGLLAAMRNVTLQKAAEDALRRSEERYRFLFEHVDDGFCIVDIVLDEQGQPIDYLFIEANPSFERHTGLVEAVGKTVRELIPDIEEHWIQIYGEVALTGSPRRFEQGSDAMGRWFDVYAFRVDDANSRRVAIFFRDISDRRNAELQIAQGAQHLRNVLNSVAAFVGVVTPDGILLQANRTSLQAANLKHADVIGKHFADTYWWSYDESVQEQLRNAIARAATGEVIRYDVKVRVGAERYIIIDFMLAPIVDEHGQVTHLIPSGVDVTERRLMESALRQSEERLRLATDAGNIGIFDHDLRQDRVEYTDIYLAITGLNDLRSPTRADRWGRVHPEDWPLLEEKIQRAEERGESYDMEYRIFHPDGSLHWMVVSALVITDAEGRGVRVTGAVRDITNRKQAEETIRHSEERFRSTFEQAAVGMAHTDQNGYYVQVNERLCEIVGYTRAELLQKRFIELVHPDERARNSALNEQLIAGELPSYAVEKRYIRRDGSFVWVHVTASSVYDELREVSYRLAVIEDISARKAAEAALQELNATLEQRIRSRTAELERSNRELDQFAYVASHDLRAPLRAINHLANWIVEDANEVLPPASQQHLATLRGRIQRMEKLLEDLLTYSRVGRRPTTVEPVDSGDLVAQIVEMLNPPPGFSVTAVGKLPTFSTRRVPLELVLRNLIQNAIKHHDRADGHVNVSVREEAEWVEFAVQDDGPGIAPAFHERIFHIFQTLQPRDEVEGSGMGLAVVKKVVESIGGAISVDSLEGQGATFRFTWPKVGAE